MNHTALNNKILGLEIPWIVTDVSLDIIKVEVRDKIKFNSTTSYCPACGKECSIYDNRSPRTWRHLHTYQMKTYLTGNLARINCPDHGVQTVSVP